MAQLHGPLPTPPALSWRSPAGIAWRGAKGFTAGINKGSASRMTSRNTNGTNLSAGTTQRQSKPRSSKLTCANGRPGRRPMPAVRSGGDSDQTGDAAGQFTGLQCGEHERSTCREGRRAVAGLQNVQLWSRRSGTRWESKKAPAFGRAASQKKDARLHAGPHASRSLVVVMPS